MHILDVSSLAYKIHLRGARNTCTLDMIDRLILLPKDWRGEGPESVHGDRGDTRQDRTKYQFRVYWLSQRGRGGSLAYCEYNDQVDFVSPSPDLVIAAVPVS